MIKNVFLIIIIFVSFLFSDIDLDDDIDFEFHILSESGTFSNDDRAYAKTFLNIYPKDSYDIILEKLPDDIPTEWFRARYVFEDIGETITAQIGKTLSDTDTQSGVLTFLLRICGVLKLDSLTDTFAHLLNHRSSAVKARTIYALGRCGNDDYSDSIVKIAVSDTHIYTHRYFVKYIGDVKSKKLVENIFSIPLLEYSIRDEIVVTYSKLLKSDINNLDFLYNVTPDTYKYLLMLSLENDTRVQVIDFIKKHDFVQDNILNEAALYKVLSSYDTDIIKNNNLYFDIKHKDNMHVKYYYDRIKY